MGKRNTVKRNTVKRNRGKRGGRNTEESIRRLLSVIVTHVSDFLTRIHFMVESVENTAYDRGKISDSVNPLFSRIDRLMNGVQDYMEDTAQEKRPLYSLEDIQDIKQTILSLLQQARDFVYSAEFQTAIDSEIEFLEPRFDELEEEIKRIPQV